MFHKREPELSSKFSSLNIVNFDELDGSKFMIFSSTKYNYCREDYEPNRILYRAEMFWDITKKENLSNAASFFDPHNVEDPGPGAHSSMRIDRQTPSKWKFGLNSERDTFLEKHHQEYPIPAQYDINYEPTLPTAPEFSFPKSETQKPVGEKQDEISRFEYSPKVTVVKKETPKFTFGYAEETNYDNGIPGPNSYETAPKFSARSSFNKTQGGFSTSVRPEPYGEHGKFPGVGNYRINIEQEGKGWSFGGQERKISSPQIEGTVPVKGYNITGEIKNSNKGWSIRSHQSESKIQKRELSPAPNHYDPKELDSKRNILIPKGERPELYNKDQISYPSPHNHVTSSEFYKTKKSVSFTREIKERVISSYGPGPGKYNLQTRPAHENGYIGRKNLGFGINPTPAASDYQPNYDIGKPNSQRVISYETQRENFSKSTTGNVGPGNYLIEKEARSELGKMSRSLKFEKNRNANPGPGLYEIPSTIGKLPKYYCGPRKLSSTGYTTFGENFNRTQKYEKKPLPEAQQCESELKE